MFKRIFIVLSLLYFQIQPAFCISTYQNDLKTLLSNDRAVIFALNIRTFNAKDTNEDELIQIESGEQRGNFINAIERLDELKSMGINTIHLLPITMTGKTKSLGTAGSVYSLLSFNKISPDLDFLANNMPVKDEAKLFVAECHKRGIRVMLDLPSCGSYDLFKIRPELFMKDKNGNSVVPLDWSDVRLYEVWSNKDKKILNKELLNEHKKFIDMCINLKIDGIRSDVAALKPPEFWSDLIKYARAKDKEFGFLAESSDSWRNPIHKDAPITQPEELLAAGYDAYYGSYMKTFEWKNANELNDEILFNLKLTNSYKDKKSVIGSFATYDMISPVSVGGIGLSKFITVLEVTLPKVNPYFITGFETGDEYNYNYSNKPAAKTYTDCKTYFVHKGRMDMFNYSRKPGGKYQQMPLFIKSALNFRERNIDLITKGNYEPMITNNKVLVFKRTYQGKSILVVANLDCKNSQIIRLPAKTSIKPLLNSEKSLNVINSNSGTELKLTPSQAIIFSF